MAITAPPTTEPDCVTAKNLRRLLSRLDQKLGSPLAGGDGRSLPPPDSLERSKIAANLDYARQLLHKLESDTSAITVPSKQQKALADLGAQKQIIRRLNESLHFASQAEDETEDQEGGGSSGTESESADQAGEPEDDDYARLNRPKHKPVAPLTALGQEPPRKVPPPPSSTLRNRIPKTEYEKRNELFGGRGNAEATTESVLDDHMKVQEDITSDLLNMAKMLKESSMEFNRSLEDEKGYLDQAKAGLDRNAMGMQSAGKRIDDLQKNETVSFYWSIIYLVSIVLLAFLTLFILFFAPKLRWW